jgi:ABC-type transporter Mla subunit MlaD
MSRLSHFVFDPARDPEVLEETVRQQAAAIDELLERVAMLKGQLRQQRMALHRAITDSISQAFDEVSKDAE